VPKKRRFSEEPFGPTIVRLMDETATTYRGLAAKTGLSAGYLNHIVHGSRPVPSNNVIAKLAKALVKLVDSGQPPLRWVAGADALPTAEQKARDLLAQIDAHRDLSASLTYDDALPAKA